MENNTGTGTVVASPEVGDSRWFAVWGLGPLGECACPKGRVMQEVRDARIANRGTCDSPGKHPLVFRLSDGKLFGFPAGLRDAVTWEQWAGMRSSVLAAGGREAVALGGDMWVLDVDNSDAWAALVRLFKFGVLSFDRVLRVVRTVRGWHVWVPVEAGDGWRTGGAQRALNDAVEAVGGVAGKLEVKSGGGYVLWSGGDRQEVPVMLFAQAVAEHAKLVHGWGSLAARRAARGVGEILLAVGDYAVGSRDALPPASVEFPPEVWGDVDVDPATIAASRMATLRVRASELASTAEGSRNVKLNRLGFLEGRAALEAGCDLSEVVGVLRGAGLRSGLRESEVQRTIASSLRDLL